MKSFKELATESTEVNELKIDSKTYQKFSSEAIKNINLMIEYGRKSKEIETKITNSLLDAIKNIHNADSAIEKSEESPKKVNTKQKSW